MRSKLRHPVRAIREPFGTAGLIVACVALIAALGGTAFAAAKLNSTQKKEVEKIAKKYAGAPGATGATGPAGTNGTNGKDGTNGTNGEKGAPGAPGSPGSPGTPGTNGKSVVTGSFTGSGGSCTEGGATVEVQGEASTKKYICDGEEGSAGAPGSPGAAGQPWTPNNTLPSGATETGAWTLPGGVAGEMRTAISFPIQLAAPLDEAHVGIVFPGGALELIEQGLGTVNEPPVNCLGSPAAPTASVGFLCIYMSKQSEMSGILAVTNLESSRVFGAGTAGAMVSNIARTATAQAYGTWAVTG